MAAIVNFLVKTVVPIGGLLYAEQVYFREKLAPVYEASSAFPGLNVPKAFGFVLVVNIILSGFLLVYLGTKVGAARNTFKEKALKDGDKDAEARFSYPKMQAEGFSEHAKLFNCVQRGHQQALETYTFFVGLSVIGGSVFPLSTVFAGLLWFFSRIKWAEGYRTGEPSKRYQNWVAYGIWSSLIIVMLASVVTSVRIMQ